MKKFKTKRNRNQSNYKYLILIIVFIVFITIFMYLSSHKLNKSYSQFINYLYNNLGITNKKNPNPLNYLMGNLDFLITDYMFYDNEIKDSIIVKNEINPLIYIYSTHDEEKYKESNEFNIKPTVITASYMLKDALSTYNIESYVEEKRVSNYLKNKKYSESYEVSRTFLEEAVLKNNSYEYFIDIHRDSVKKEHTQITIDGKEYARIMFVLGLDNKNYQENKKIITKINDYLNKFYPGLSRGIYEKSGKGVNGVYNQDFHKNTMLIEIGGVDSNLNSVFNSTEIIAKCLYDIIGDLNEKNY